MFRNAILSLGLILLCLGAHPAPAAGGWRVCVAHSYNPEYIWTRQIDSGVTEGMKGLDVEFTYLYLDAKRQPDPEALRRNAQAMARRIQELDPQIVIAADDAVQSYLVLPYLKGRVTPQVIFCGVNAPLSAYGYPVANISGVRERWHFRQGFALLKKIAPELNSVTVFGDVSESSTYVLKDLREDQKGKGPFALRLNKVIQVHSFQAWQRAILRHQHPGEALALGLYYTLIDENTGRVVTPEKVIAWTHAHNTRPTLGFADYAMDHGLLCGVLERGQEQGFLAGQMARQIIEQGGPASRLLPRINEQGVVFVNLKEAERIGLLIPYEIIKAAQEVSK